VSGPAPIPAASRARLGVLTFAFLLAVITYLDRVCISAAAPFISEDLHLTTVEMGQVLSAFALAYSVFEIPSGWLGDVAGPRRVLTRIVLWWSAFTMLTGAAMGFRSLVATRVLFGAGEAGAFPNMSRSLSRWFPLSERARANGLCITGLSIGSFLMPPLVSWMVLNLSWERSFYVAAVAAVLALSAPSALAQNAPELAEHPVLAGWLHRTAQNLAANTVRTDVRRHAREQEAAAMNELLANEPDASWEHIAPHLDAALGELNEQDHDAVLLRYFERKSAREMAETLGVSEEAQTLTFAGDIPLGWHGRLMKANFDRLIDGATGAARGSRLNGSDQPPDLAILISCVGRRMVLRQRTEEELESVRDVFGPTTFLTGFYSYGEISPFTPETASSMLSCMYWEKLKSTPRNSRSSRSLSCLTISSLVSPLGHSP